MNVNISVSVDMYNSGHMDKCERMSKLGAHECVRAFVRSLVLACMRVCVDI